MGSADVNSTYELLYHDKPAERGLLSTLFGAGRPNSIVNGKYIPLRERLKEDYSVTADIALTYLVDSDKSVVYKKEFYEARKSRLKKFGLVTGATIVLGSILIGGAIIATKKVTEYCIEKLAETVID